MKWMPDRSGGADLYIDLGTANTLVVSRRDGLIINEPSVVAFHESDGGARTIIAVGNEAKIKLGKTHGHLKVICPLEEGVVADFEVTEAMLRYFIRKAWKSIACALIQPLISTRESSRGVFITGYP